jgi:hypothetical protein
MSPAVVGPPLLIFDTALDLFEYIHNFMPWHDRGSMTESESWSVSAYILSINGIAPGIQLNRESAALIDLRGGSETDGPAAGPPATDEGAVPANRVPAYWTAAIVAVLVMAVLGMLFVARRSRR